MDFKIKLGFGKISLFETLRLCVKNQCVKIPAVW